MTRDAAFLALGFFFGTLFTAAAVRFLFWLEQNKDGEL
jgi:hypothetical protein